MKLPFISRPERMRARAEVDQTRQRLKGAAVADDHEGKDRRDVLAMLDSPGWQVIKKRLVEKNIQLWDLFRDPRVAGDRATLVRMEAIKYSGIEDVIEEILLESQPKES